MDRIDIHIDVPAVNYKEMRSTSVPEASVLIRERVIAARQIQLQRFAGSRQRIYCNAQMSSSHVRTFCDLSADCERLLERAMTQQGLSARAHDGILKVAADRSRPGIPGGNPTEAHSGGDSVQDTGSDLLGLTGE